MNKWLQGYFLGLLTIPWVMVIMALLGQADLVVNGHAIVPWVAMSDQASDKGDGV